jgi:hypothetical protein
MKKETTKCMHCGRTITATSTGWADMEATGDDKIWRYTCDENDTFPSDHEAEENLGLEPNRVELENKLATIMNKKENAIEILVGRLSSVVTAEQLSVLITAEEGTQ